MLKDTPSNFKSRIFPVPRVKMMWSGKAEDLLQHRYVQTQKLHWSLHGNYMQLYTFFCWNILCIWMHMSHVHTSLSVVPKKLNCCGRRSSQEYWRSWELQGSEVTAVRFIHAFDIDVCHFVNNKSAHIQLGYTGYTRYIHIHIHIHTHKTGLYLWKPNPGSFDSNMVRQRIVPSTCGDHPQMLHHGFCHNSTKRGKLL